MRRIPILVALACLVAAPACAPDSTAGGPVEPAPGPLVLVDDDPAPKREPKPKPPPEASPAPRPPVAPPILPEGVLAVGAIGVEVLQMEERLASLGYMVGRADALFDQATRHGVIAFQKVEGIGPTGQGDFLTLARLTTAERPAPAYTTPADHLEVDIPRQVVFVVRGGEVAAVLPTSTGNNKLFRSQGWTRRATTPNGQFAIGHKISSWRKSPLGVLYKPSYFNGGIAFHGAPSVPTSPASHGCVRLPMPFADWFYRDASPPGTVVYVYGGPHGENPQSVIEDAPLEGPPPAEPAPTPEATPTALPNPLPSLLPGLPVPTP